MQIKRRFARWQVNVQAELGNVDNDTQCTCVVSDISLKGARLFMKEKLQRDNLLNLAIALSDTCVLFVEAWVVWHRCIEGCNHYGLYFKQIRDQDKDKIYSFMCTSRPQSIARRWREAEDTGGQTMEDRRIFERFSVRLPLRFLNINSGKECIAETRDISVKGVGLVASEEFAVRTPLELWVDVPNGGGPFYSRGQVAWSRPAPDGQYFTGVNLDHADLMGVARILRAAKK